MSNPQDPYGQQPDPNAQPDPYARPDPYAQGGYQYGYGQQQPYQQGYQQQGYQYPGQQYSGQQYPGQQYSGQQYPGQPPQKPNRTGLYAAVGIAVVVVIAVAIAAVLLVVNSNSNESDASAGPSTGPTSVTPSTGGDCGVPGTGLASEITDRVASGPLSFPVSAAPGWEKESYTVYAQSIAAAGLQKSMDDGQPWQAGAEVGQTNFNSKLDPKDAASRMIQCIADGAGYLNVTSKRVEQSAAESITVDGVPAAKVTGKILVTGDRLTVAGDDITVIVIASAPQTYAMLVIPIGRDDMAATGKAIIEQLKVAKDV
ncbi:hypothetical protein FK529_03395 [Tsukamurella asaccharolytica]|uniref:Uncharacterized protein n=1 Tax=Tsukamurella asaccharolytica TaxID=2592067 RepID=A0A5C5RCR5_9ACTN|nr:hypothetical protein [Tsukamurella asaccharolytica]TWS20412.1 hypothetical protein FK529_03395 [Tsukamurella asaccharolytica]